MNQEMSLKEAARAIQVPYGSVWYWYKLGKLPVRKIAGRNLIEPRVLQCALRNLGYQPKDHRVRLQGAV